MDKNHPRLNLPDKKPSGKTPGQKPPWTKTNPCKEICMYACTAKSWRDGVRDVWRTLEGSRDVWIKCERGGGQNWSKISDVLYGRPLGNYCTNYSPWISQRCRSPTALRPLCWSVPHVWIFINFISILSLECRPSMLKCTEQCCVALRTNWWSHESVAPPRGRRAKRI